MSSSSNRPGTWPSIEVKQRWKHLAADAPSWLVSLVVHIVVLLALAAITIPMPRGALLGIVTSTPDDSQIDLDQLDLETDVSLSETTVTQTVEVPMLAETSLEMSGELDALATEGVSSDLDSLQSISELVSASASLGPLQGALGGGALSGSGLEGRQGTARARMVRQGGGTKKSEKAVDAGLQWIARHQLPDGSWNFDHRYGECDGRCEDPGNMTSARGAATGLALLCYLGAGQTHSDGDYQGVVKAGVRALVNLMKRDDIGLGYWDKEGKMYSHGIATMALCEAYAMTEDSLLRDPAQAAINYIVSAQDPQGGGWRYEPRQAGDTSVMGWQLGGLKSGYLSALSIPPNTIAGASAYLESVEEEGGTAFVYAFADRRKSGALTAIGTLCRMYLGSPKEDPRLVAGINALAAAGPSTRDCYYNYYAAQALFHFTGGEGPMWKTWNDNLREALIASQSSEGHEAGSWKPLTGEHGAVGGGRLYTTAMSTMTLEVYYRMMPIYKSQAVDSGFDEEKGQQPRANQRTK